MVSGISGKMAGVAGVEPGTSAVTGQRSNQLSYTPVKGERESTQCAGACQRTLPVFLKRIRAADAKEVGVGNPAEETYRYPNQSFLFPTLNIGSQMSMHKARRKFCKAFLEVGDCGRKACSFCVAWQASYEAGAPFIG